MKVLVYGAVVHFAVTLLMLCGAGYVALTIPYSKRPGWCVLIGLGLIVLGLANMIP